MSDDMYDKLMSALRDFKEDLTTRIETLRKDVDKKFDKLSSDYEKSREEIVRLTTHMEFMQTSLSEAKAQINGRVDKVADQVTTNKDSIMEYISSRFKQEEETRNEKISSLDKTINSTVELKLQNLNLNTKIFIYSSVFVGLLWVLKMLLQSQFNISF